MGSIQIDIKRQSVIANFNILLLGQDKAVLKIIQLREYNLKINQTTKQIKIQNIKKWR